MVNYRKDARAGALRPHVQGVQANEILRRSCIWLDGYLYNKDHYLLLVLEPREGGKTELPVIGYKLVTDMFGLWTETKLFALPLHKGTPVHVDRVPNLNVVQRKQLRRLIVLLAISERARFIGHKRHSIKLHCIAPKPCDPFDGLPNVYAKSARAARDELNAARAGRLKERKQAKARLDEIRAQEAERMARADREHRAQLARENFGHDKPRTNGLDSTE